MKTILMMGTALGLMACGNTSVEAQDVPRTEVLAATGETATAVFAGGCFWCIEKDFEKYVDGVIDVRYGADSQYLDVDGQYLVSAAVDADIGALASKVSPDAPLFGGDAVVGVNDREIDCPNIDDPIQTINVDGTPVESGLLTPFFDDKRLLLATILVPAAIVGAVLVGLVLLRRAIGVGFRGIFAIGRAAITPTGDHRAARVRHHAGEYDADRSEWGDGIDGDRRARRRPAQAGREPAAARPPLRGRQHGVVDHPRPVLGGL